MKSIRLRSLLPTMLRRERLGVIGLTVWIALLLCLFVGGVLATHLSAVWAFDPIQAALARAAASGAYHFNAEITQHVLPIASVDTVGHQSRDERFSIEGQTDLRQDTAHLTFRPTGPIPTSLSGFGVRQAGLEMQIDGTRVQTRLGDGPWKEAPAESNAMLPNGNPMDYLAVARQVHVLGQEMRNGFSYTRYGFEIDGPIFARHMRDLLVRRLQASGQLPQAMQLAPPEQYAQMTGAGEFWVRDDGLPLRQTLVLTFPPQKEEQVKSEITIDFSHFAPVPASPWAWLQYAWLDVAAQSNSALMLSLVLGLVALMVLCPQSRRLRQIMTVILITSMFGSPLWQAKQAVALGKLQQAAQPSPSRLSASTPAPVTADSSDFPLFSIEDNVDSDQDGLTNYQEQLLGTSYVSGDSDGDLISDALEVQTPVYQGKNLDPMSIDTNHDGLADTIECPISDDGLRLICGDYDNDGVPDAFDRDNDNDGISDNLDISPNAPQMISTDMSMGLVLSGLTPSKTTYVEFQLRPLSVSHLRYAYNALDWPANDRKGQIRNVDVPFFQDDTKLIPMLEIRVPDGGVLPSAEELANYGITRHKPDATGVAELVYVPLQLVTDPSSDERVAFAGKMVYHLGAAGWGAAHQMRLVWVVQMLNDICITNEVTCQSGTQGYALNQPQVVQTYMDKFRLTGLAVHENHGVDIAQVYVDPNAPVTNLSSDASLALLAKQLDTTFLGGRDCDRADDNGICIGNGQRDITLTELRRRFDRTSNAGVPNDQRWGLPNNFRVDPPLTYLHRDEALLSTAMTTTKALLNQVFTPRWSSAQPITPTVLFVREERYRAANLSGAGNALSLTLNQVALDLGRDGGLRVETLGGLNWTPYGYDAGLQAWHALSLEEYAGELGLRNTATAEVGDTEQVLDGKQVLAQLFWQNLNAGVIDVIPTVVVTATTPISISDQALTGQFANLMSNQALGTQTSVAGLVNFLYFEKFADGEIIDIRADRPLIGLQLARPTPRHIYDHIGYLKRKVEAAKRLVGINAASLDIQMSLNGSANDKTLKGLKARLNILKNTASDSTRSKLRNMISTRLIGIVSYVAGEALTVGGAFSFNTGVMTAGSVLLAIGAVADNLVETAEVLSRLQTIIKGSFALLHEPQSHDVFEQTIRAVNPAFVGHVQFQRALG